eukprot:174319_1
MNSNMLFKSTFITLLMTLQTLVHSGIIGIYHELSDSLKLDLQKLVQNGKYTVFGSVLIDYGLDLSNDATLTLWDYICALNVDDDDTCAAFGTQTSFPVDGNIAYAQLEMYGAQTFTGYWDTIKFTTAPFNKTIYFDQQTAEITFGFEGVYKCTIGYRGAGSDVWNAIRVLGILSGTAGISNAAGVNSSPNSFTFLFLIDDLLDSYVIQKGTVAGTSAALLDAPDWNDASESPPSITALIEYVASA